MRKIETIKKDIERAQAAIRKAEEALPRLETRMNNAIAKLAKAGYEFKGDGNDTKNCVTNGLWTPAYTADQAREGIERRKSEIFGRRMDLDRLNKELAESEAKVNAIPKAIKVYQGELERSLIIDRKFRRTFAQNDIAERKDNGEWYSVDDYYDARREAYKAGHGSDAWTRFCRIEAARDEQEKLKRMAALTDAQIEKGAAEDAATLVQDLAQRVERYVGTATDCSGLSITHGTHGYSVLNGIVIGEKGRCEVVSKGVAGYNIVCWHIRVNVFPVKGEA